MNSDNQNMVTLMLMNDHLGRSIEKQPILYHHDQKNAESINEPRPECDKNNSRKQTLERFYS